MSKLAPSFHFYISCPTPFENTQLLRLVPFAFQIQFNQSIGIDNPCLSCTDISQANTVSFESDYGCPRLNNAYYGIYLYPYFINFPCPQRLSTSEELDTNTDNTTLVPPRLPDTLPQVYHKRRPTLGLLIVGPSVSPIPSPNYQTLPAHKSIRLLAKSAERARISTINLDDYQLDPLKKTTTLTLHVPFQGFLTSDELLKLDP
ncbi:hypothetical protein Tco_0386386 [Tanacetum coccineum]